MQIGLQKFLDERVKLESVGGAVLFGEASRCPIRPVFNRNRIAWHLAIRHGNRVPFR